jgi:Zn-dependent oligopeptidase
MRTTMERYDYSAISPQTVRQAADEGLAEAERLIAQVVQVAGPRTFENTLVPLSDAAAAVWTSDGRALFIFGQLHPDGAVRDAATETRDRTEKWRNGLAGRDDLAHAVRVYAVTEDAAGLTGARRRVLDLWLRDIRRAGHALDPASRTELSRLQDRIVELSLTFSRNLADWNDAIELGDDGVAGLSPEFLEQLPDGVAPGTKRLPIVRSSVVPFLEQSERRHFRERALKQYFSQAAEENREILDELLALRRQAARLLGAKSWSQFANEARMSGGAAAVREFLDSVFGPLRDLAPVERAAMQSLLVAEGVEDELQAWDWRYYHERQRRAIGLDSSELSAYLPLEAVLGGLFELVRDVFRVLVAEERATTGWHPDVRFFVLHDTATGEHLADLYVDLIARDGKSPAPVGLGRSIPARTSWDRSGVRPCASWR